MAAADAGAVRALLTEAFGRDDEARLVETLARGDDLATGLVAELGDEIAGIAALCYLRSPEGALGLGPIAVAPSARHRGIGGALIEASVDWAVLNDTTGLFVLGRPRYYTRFGFTVERAAGFSHSWPAEFMLAREIGQDRLPQDGELVYPPVYAALG